MNRFKIIFITSALLFTFQNALAFDEFTNSEATLFEDDFDENDFLEFESENTVKIQDPYEKINRKIYVFNDVFDQYFFEHVARFYRKGVPHRPRKMVGNFIRNLSLPLSALNSFLQGKTDNGLATISNFLINSTIGVFGLFEIASEKGIRYDSEDFGQTLGHYNVGSGSYLMLPFFGPSSTRDFSGWIVDRVVSPTGFNEFQISGRENIVDPGYLVGLSILSAVNTRESLIEALDGIRKDSFDPYATIRSAYLQRRINEVKK